MLKIIKKKEYQRLIDIENKYRLLTGQTFTLWTGGRSRRSALLQMDKEELVRIIFDLNNKCIKQTKEIIKYIKLEGKSE